MGRVVKTHSTYIKGLIPWLSALSKYNDIQTITPAAIKKVRGKNHGLDIRISTRILGGFKAIARKGMTMQEVFIITKLDKKELEIKIRETKP